MPSSEQRRIGFNAAMRRIHTATVYSVHREDALSQGEEQPQLLPLPSPQHGCYPITHYRVAILRAYTGSKLSFLSQLQRTPAIPRVIGVLALLLFKGRWMMPGVLSGPASGLTLEPPLTRPSRVLRPCHPARRCMFLIQRGVIDVCLSGTDKMKEGTLC